MAESSGPRSLQSGLVKCCSDTRALWRGLAHPLSFAVRRSGQRSPVRITATKGSEVCERRRRPLERACSLDRGVRILEPRFLSSHLPSPPGSLSLCLGRGKSEHFPSSGFCHRPPDFSRVQELLRDLGLSESGGTMAATSYGCSAGSQRGRTAGGRCYIVGDNSSGSQVGQIGPRFCLCP